jgi:hypothetical protein
MPFVYSVLIDFVEAKPWFKNGSLKLFMLHLVLVRAPLPSSGNFITNEQTNFEIRLALI